MSLIRATKSVTTFLRRLTLEAAFGLAPEDDDDGQGHQGAKGQQQQEPQPQQPQLNQRAQTVINTFRNVGIGRDHMEKKFGVAADEWTDDHYERMTIWRGEIKGKGPPELQRDFARELFGLPALPTREPGEEG
jgi:hypothetical protein